MSIGLKMSTKSIIDHVRLYASFVQIFNCKKDAITKINTITAYCCRNNLNGFLTTELITCVNNSDQVVYIINIVKLYK